MKIEKDTVASIDYTLKNDEGEIVDTSEGRSPLLYLHGHDNIVPGLERALEGKVVGDVVDVVVAPADGYGERDESRTFEIPKSELPENIKPEKGLELSMQAPNGASMPVVVTKVKLNTIVLDANHPLAGQNLHFHVEVKEIRKAKKEELAHGHAHAPGHHHHH